MAHVHEESLRRIDEAMLRGDMDAFFSNFADDVKVHVRGNHKLAGDYSGKQELEGLFSRFMEAMGDYTFQNHAYLADDEHGVTLQTGRAERDGRTLEIQEAFILHFRDGKVSEFWYVPVDGPAFDTWIGR